MYFAEYVRFLADSLGAPAWIVTEVERYIESVPAGEEAQTPAWLRAVDRAKNELRRRYARGDPRHTTEWNAEVKGEYQRILKFELRVPTVEFNVIEEWVPAEPRSLLPDGPFFKAPNWRNLLGRGVRYENLAYECLRRLHQAGSAHVAKLNGERGTIHVIETSWDMFKGVLEVVPSGVMFHEARTTANETFPVWNATNAFLRLALSTELGVDFPDVTFNLDSRIVARTIREQVLLEYAKADVEAHPGIPQGWTAELWLTQLLRKFRGPFDEDAPLPPSTFPPMRQPIPDYSAFLPLPDPTKERKRIRSPSPEHARRTRAREDLQSPDPPRYEDAVTPTYQSTPIPYTLDFETPEVIPSPLLSDRITGPPSIRDDYSILAAAAGESRRNDYVEPEDQYVEVAPVEESHLAESTSLSDPLPASYRKTLPSSANPEDVYHEELLPTDRRTVALGPEMAWSLHATVLFLRFGPVASDSPMGRFLRRPADEIEDFIYRAIGAIVGYAIQKGEVSESGKFLYTLTVQLKRPRDVRLAYLTAAQSFVLAPEWAPPVTLASGLFTMEPWPESARVRLETLVEERRQERRKLYRDHRAETLVLKAGWITPLFARYYGFPEKIVKAMVPQPQYRGQVIKYQKGAPYCPMTIYTFTAEQLASAMELFRLSYGAPAHPVRKAHELECGKFYQSLYSLGSYAYGPPKPSDPASFLSVPLPTRGVLRSLFDFCCDGAEQWVEEDDRPLPKDGVPRAFHRVGYYRLETFSWHENVQEFRITRADLRIRTGFYGKDYEKFSPLYLAYSPPLQPRPSSS